MRIVLPVLLVVLSAVSATAGMTPEQMRARMAEIHAELLAIDDGQSAPTIKADLRDVDQRRFQTDLDLARLNARREVILVRAKEEEERNKVEHEVLQRKLDTLQKQRSMVQSELAKASEKVDAGQLPAQEVTPIKLQLIKLDEETATLEYEMSGGGVHFRDALVDIEVDLAGINAMRKALDAREVELKARYQKLFESSDKQQKLVDELNLLTSELQRVTSSK